MPNGAATTRLAAEPAVPVRPGEPAISMTMADGLVRARAGGRAMGTDCQVLVVTPTSVNAAAAAATAWSGITTLDSLWSRFRPDSALSSLNRAAAAAAGELTDWTDDLTAALIAAMSWAFRFSDALVDAAVLDRVIAAGYDRDFAEVTGTSTSSGVGAGIGPEPATMADVQVAGNFVTRPAGTTLDSGGVGKGFAADLIATSLAAAGAEGVLVDLGGDIRAIGRDLDSGPWRVDVADERGAPSPGHQAIPTLTQWSTVDGGIATSSTARRRWRGGHHLIDPRTGRPSDSDLLAVTVQAADALTAETCTKTALLLGTSAAKAWLPSRVRQALLTDIHGGIHQITGTVEDSQRRTL